VVCLCMWLLGSPGTAIVSVHLSTDVDCKSIGEDQSFYDTNFLHFQLHFLAKLTPFHFVCWSKGLHKLLLVRFRTLPLTQYLLHRHYRHSQFLAYSRHRTARTSLNHLTYSFNVVMRNTRSTSPPAFTEVSVPPD
jgi:hypothetical protein